MPASSFYKLTTRFILVILVSSMSQIAGCEREAPSPDSKQDPWMKNLEHWSGESERFRAEYADNSEKLYSDWQDLLKDADLGEIDADALIDQIVEMGRSLETQTRKLKTWNDQIFDELGRRGFECE